MIDEGVIKFRSDWCQSGPLENPEIEELIRWRKPLHAAGLIGHYADVNIGYGNLSMRLAGSGQFIISGTQTGYLADLDASHFALITDYDIAENRLSSTGASEASSESLTHAMLYELDPATRAVVHVHDSSAWAALAGKLPTTSENVPYGTPGMALEFRRLWTETTFAGGGVAVMAGHDSGLVAIGNSLEEATRRILAATTPIGARGE
jgi:ribulose-5-phosphate 4-epimerase/fuculose-1-phosphate aldolase